jgi:PAS domain S-box-containing protein
MTQNSIERRAWSEFLECERRVLERIANGAPLAEILETLVTLIEDQAGDMRCAVLLTDPTGQGLQFVAAPNIPEDYKTDIQPFLRIAPGMGSCGTAAFLREPVYTRDTANNPLWKDCGDIAFRNGLRAIWSTPILADDNEVLGTFAMYYGEPRLPSPEHIQLIDMATQMGRVAIDAKRAEDALHQSEDRLRLVIETIPAMVWTALPDGSVCFVNGRWLEYIGLSWQEFQARGWPCFVHPEDLGRSKQYWEATVASGQPAQIEQRVRRADGQYRWLLARSVPLRDEAGKIVNWYGTATDIDDSKRAEASLRQSADELQAVSRRLVELQETERRDLARELHDRLGQNLTALSINLAVLKAELSSHPSQDITSRLDDSAALLESTTRAIESVESDLRPPMVDDHGLPDALEWYAEQFSARTGVAVHVSAERAYGRAAAEVEMALFRIAQEALNNVAKHARATQVDIDLRCPGSEHIMSISDNGVGFDTMADRSDGRRAGLGMLMMRERAQAIGGRFHVQALPGGGTQLTVHVPR